MSRFVILAALLGLSLPLKVEMEEDQKVDTSHGSATNMETGSAVAQRALLSNREKSSEGLATGATPKFADYDGPTDYEQKIANKVFNSKCPGCPTSVSDYAGNNPIYKIYAGYEKYLGKLYKAFFKYVKWATTTPVVVVY